MVTRRLSEHVRLQGQKLRHILAFAKKAKSKIGSVSFCHLVLYNERCACANLLKIALDAMFEFHHLHYIIACSLASFVAQYSPGRICV